MKVATMKYVLGWLLNLLLLSTACAQSAPPDRPELMNPEFDKKLGQMLGFSVPLIGVDELNKIQHEVHIFDTRKRVEYEVSHIAGAVFAGEDLSEYELLSNIPKTDTIVLYCSVGYRSEKAGNKLRSLGYTKVYNLYGSLFEWANRQYPLVDKHGNPTQRIHTYNRNWSRWVEDGKAEKTW